MNKQQSLSMFYFVFVFVNFFGCSLAEVVVVNGSGIKDSNCNTSSFVKASKFCTNVAKRVRENSVVAGLAITTMGLAVTSLCLVRALSNCQKKQKRVVDDLCKSFAEQKKSLENNHSESLCKWQHDFKEEENKRNLAEKKLKEAEDALEEAEAKAKKAAEDGKTKETEVAKREAEVDEREKELEAAKSAKAEGEIGEAGSRGHLFNLGRFLSTYLPLQG